MGFQEYPKLSSELHSQLGGTAGASASASSNGAKKILASAAAIAEGKEGKKGGKKGDKKHSPDDDDEADGGASTSGGPSVLVGSATVPFRPEWDRHALTPRHMAYMRVAEGCDHKCTFCAIPGFRGKFRSKARRGVELPPLSSAARPVLCALRCASSAAFACGICPVNLCSPHVRIR